MSCGKGSTTDSGGLDYVFGVAREAETTTIVTSGTSANAALTANSVYRVICTEDCYISFYGGADPTVATVAGVYMKAGIPEIFSTDDTYTNIAVIQFDTAGVLHVTRMGDRRG